MSVTQASAPDISPDALRILEQQLGRMRGLQYNYYDQFFRFLNLHLLGLFALTAVALAGFERAALLLPFWVIFIGFHSSYLFSYVTFARTYATAIEQRLNQHLGGEYLVAHQLEATYIFPISRPRMVAWSPVNPGSFLSAETVQFTVGLSALFIVFGVWGTRVAWDVGSVWGTIYVAGLAVWTAGCMGFIFWYHFISDYEARLRSVLEERYGARYTGHRGASL
jgi:hypothetical protein